VGGGGGALSIEVGTAGARTRKKKSHNIMRGKEEGRGTKQGTRNEESAPGSEGATIHNRTRRHCYPLRGALTKESRWLRPAADKTEHSKVRLERLPEKVREKVFSGVGIAG